MFKRWISEESDCEGVVGNVSLWSNGSFKYSNFVRRLTAATEEMRRKKKIIPVALSAIEEDMRKEREIWSYGVGYIYTYVLLSLLISIRFHHQ